MSRFHRRATDSLTFIRFHDDPEGPGTVKRTATELQSLNFNVVKKKKKFGLSNLIRREMAFKSSHIALKAVVCVCVCIYVNVN